MVHNRAAIFSRPVNGSAPFFGLGVSTLLFSASYGSAIPTFGCIGYGTTMVAIMLSIVTLLALKKYPEPKQGTDEEQGK